MQKKYVVRKRYGGRRCRVLRVMCALTILATCTAFFVAGIADKTSIPMMVWQGIAATVAIGFIFKIAIKVVSSYEEMDGG